MEYMIGFSILSTKNHVAGAQFINSVPNTLKIKVKSNLAKTLTETDNPVHI